MFEKWRVHDTSSAEKLQAEYEKDKQVQSRADFAQKWEQYGGYDADDLYGEYERDMAESNRRFDQAFRQVLSHTSAFELQEFGKLVGLGDGVRWLAPTRRKALGRGMAVAARGESASRSSADVRQLHTNRISLGLGFDEAPSDFAAQNPMALAGEGGGRSARAVSAPRKESARV